MSSGNHDNNFLLGMTEEMRYKIFVALSRGGKTHFTSSYFVYFQEFGSVQEL